MSSIPENTTLMIVPDASSNEYATHQELKEKGIDVLVLDHHQAPKVSEYACVVNNQLCDYPTKSLSGVGIVYKFCQYLDSLFGNNLADEFLDVVALGLTGDMVSMRDFETHYLTQRGLASVRNPFIKGMMDKNKRQIGDTVSPIKIAFYVVPLVNAITRVGTMEEKVLLFESMLDWKAYDLISSNKRGHKPGELETVIEQSLRTCTNVKNRQTRDQNIAAELVKNKIEEEGLLEHKVLVVKIQELTFDKGIIGLIANKVMAEYQRPVCLLTKDGTLWSGSARACGVEDFRSFCDNCGLVALAQGHPSAFGFKIEDENIPAFVELCDREFADKNFSLSYKVDFIYSPSLVRSKDILEITELDSLYGQDINEPLVAIENLSITKDMLYLMSRDKNPTLKIVLPNGISIIKFRSSEEEFDNLYSDFGCVIINIVGRCERNVYNGNVTPQILVEDYEVVTKQEYFF